MALRSNKVSHSREVKGAISVTDNYARGELVVVSDNIKIKAQFTDLAKLVGDNKNTKKLFALIFSINKSVISKSILTTEIISHGTILSISYDELTTIELIFLGLECCDI